MEKTKVFYLASPYSHPDSNVHEERYQAVMKHNAELFRAGIIAYSPIVYSHELSKKYSMPTDAEFWWFFNKAMMDRCDGLIVYMMTGWQESKGVLKEIEYAKEIGMTCVYHEENMKWL